MKINDYPLPAYAAGIWLHKNAKGQEELFVMLPAAEGHDKESIVHFRADDNGKAALVNMLRELLYKPRAKATIGSSAIPSQAEVDHRQKHKIFPSVRCPFCIQQEQNSKRLGRLRVLEVARRGDVEVRKIVPKGGLKRTKMSVGDLF